MSASIDYLPNSKAAATPVFEFLTSTEESASSLSVQNDALTNPTPKQRWYTCSDIKRPSSDLDDNHITIPIQYLSESAICVSQWPCIWTLEPSLWETEGNTASGNNRNRFL